jgi:hypothetical protein
LWIGNQKLTPLYSTRCFINILFADDTTLCQSNTNFDDLIMVFKRDVVQFFDWCAHNRMDVNWSKTFIIIIKPPRMKISIQSEITCETTTISTVNNFKLLGVELSSNLDFSNFVSKTCIQVKRKPNSIKDYSFCHCNFSRHSACHILTTVRHSVRAFTVCSNSILFGSRRK